MGAGTSTPCAGSLNRQNQHTDKKMASATLQQSGFPFQPGYINRECWGGCSHSGTSSGCDFFVCLCELRPSPWAANYSVITFNSTQHAHYSEFGLLSPLQYSCAGAGSLVLWKTWLHQEGFAYLLSARGGGASTAALLLCFTTPSGCSRAGASPAPAVGLSPESSACGFNKQAILHPGNPWTCVATGSKVKIILDQI